MPESTQHHGTRRSEGFTLIEVLVVVALVAVLSGLALVSVKDFLQRARAARTVSDMLVVSKAVEQYVLDNGPLPDADGSLTSILPLLVPQYARTLPTADAWGNDFFYEQILASAKNDNSSGGAGGQLSWTICHVTGSPDNPSVTITVAQPSVLNAHLKHGDSLGECSGPEEDESGTGGGDAYRIYSYGRDGQPDSDVVTGLYAGSDSDIVVENGMLIQWKF